MKATPTSKALGNLTWTGCVQYNKPWSRQPRSAEMRWEGERVGVFRELNVRDARS